MAATHLNTVLRHLRNLGAKDGAGRVHDCHLLDRFITQRDEAAFEALVARHGPMVQNVCRHVLHDQSAIEDAFQATFLVLVRKASSIRKGELLANWLYGVAYRTAARAKVEAARRRVRESAAPARQQADPLDEITVRELFAVLEKEVYRLPARMRAPLVLCYLEGKTHTDAARQLGCSLATLDRRLGRARDLLRTRLARHGLTLSVALIPVILASGPASASVTTALAVSTVKAAALLAVGQTPVGAVSRQALLLAEGMVKTMAVAKTKLVALLLFVLGVLGAGISLAGYHQLAAQPPPLPEAALAQPADGARPDAAPHQPSDIHGDPLPPEAITRLGTVRFRPGGYIDSIAFTPDGKRLVSHNGSWTGSGVNVWDPTTGKELGRCAPSANDLIVAALLAPDGESVVTLEYLERKHFVRVRDLADLKVTRAFPVGYMNSPRLTPDGQWLIALAGNGDEVTVEVWDLQEGKQVRSWNAHKGHVWTIELSGDGKTLATGGMDKTIRLWDVATGKLVREIDGSPNVISKVAVSRDGTLVASLGSTEIKHGAFTSFPWVNCIRIWDAATGKELRQLHMDAKGGQPSPPAFSMVAFAPDGKTLLTAGNDGACRVWDAASGKERRQIPLGTPGLTTLAFTADSKTVAVASNSIRLIDLATGKDKLPALGPQHAVGALAVAPDGRTAATINEGYVQLWDATTGRPRDRIGAEGHGVAVLCPSADGRTLITTGEDKTLRVWDLPSGKERRRFDVPNISTTGSALLSVTPDGATALLRNADNSLRVLDSATGKERLTVPGINEGIHLTALTPDGRTLLVCYGDHTAHVWDVDAGKELRNFEFVDATRPGDRLLPPAPVGGTGRGNKAWSYGAAVSLDGRLIAYGSQAHYLAIHDVAKGKAVRLVENLPPDGACPMAFSPDGHTLAWSGWRQPTIHVLELATGKERQRFDGHKGRVTSLAFAADGRTLFSSGDDTTALVWDLTGNHGAKAQPLTTTDLPTCWSDLADSDAARAFQSMRRLCASPAETVAYLRTRLTPVAVVEEKRLTRLIADLDSGQFAVREKAARELEQLDEAAAHACRQALEGRPSAEVRRRLEALVEKQSRQKWDPSRERLRALRTLEVLEFLGTPEARQVLKSLGAGAPDARLTRDAKASLGRVDRRATASP
jgi:RNA polymerase sigma factor (sigma-70 family)